jgi:uracil phosphoribosyltransferase
MAGSLRLIEHSLALHKLSILRDRSTSSNNFRRIVQQTSLILCSEMTRDLDLVEIDIETANGAKTTGHYRDQGSLVILPILRAGLVMAESFSLLLPMARTGHVGIFRDENNAHHCYMLSLPRVEQKQSYLVLDPVMAQGKTISLAVSYLLDAGVPGSQIRVGCILTSLPGIDHFYGQAQHADIDVFAVACDPELNERFHVLPGLGNASGRMFRTNEFDEEAGDYE